MERIKAAAIKLPDGRVFTGRMHGDIIQGFPGVVPREVAVQGECGFVNDKDEFVQRGRAKKIAVAAGQVGAWDDSEELFSEDLMLNDPYYYKEFDSMPKSEPENAHLLLSLYVSYELGGVEKNLMKQALEDLVQRAIGEGLLTGETPATVDAWSAHVSECGESDIKPELCWLDRNTVERNVDGVELSDHDRAEIERCRKEVFEEECGKLKAEIDKFPLTLKQETDLIWKDDNNSIWIEIENVAVHISKTDDGVAVDLCPTLCESHHTLDCCNTTFDEATEVKCRECGQYNGDGDGFDGMCPSCADKSEGDQREGG
jgi:hypothetical protein